MRRGMHRDARDLNSPRPQIDHEEDVVGPESQRRPDLSCEEVGRRDLTPVSPHERPPRRRPTGRGLDPVFFQNVRDGGPRNAMADVFQFTLDPAVTPGRVLACHANDEGSDGLHQSGTADALRLVRPLQCDQPVVPAHQGVGRHDRGDLIEGLSTEHFRLCG